MRTEYEVDNMNGVLGQKGYADYVLMGKDGLPLAVIEAKRSTKDPNIGRKQAQALCRLSGTEVWPPSDAVYHQRLHHLFLG